MEATLINKMATLITPLTTAVPSDPDSTSKYKDMLPLGSLAPAKSKYSAAAALYYYILCVSQIRCQK